LRARCISFGYEEGTPKEPEAIRRCEEETARVGYSRALPLRIAKTVASIIDARAPLNRPL
jgi:hypothetical protein